MLKPLERLALAALILLGFCCSRSTDQTSVRREDGERRATATSEGGSREVEHVGPSASTEDVGSWGETRFADDVVLQPDGGVTAADGGLPRVVSVERHEPTRKVVEAAGSERVLEAWQNAAMGEDEHVHVEVEAEKKTQTGIFDSLLSHWFVLLLAAAAGFALYRFRRALPYVGGFFR